jgi:segregation and condensation protein B
MAKRKKNKKQPKNDQVAEATAPDSNESVAPAATESPTADPPIAEGSNSAFDEEIPQQDGLAEPTQEDAALEAEYAAPWSEDIGATSPDAPPAVEVTASEQPAESASDEMATEETSTTAPEETVIEEASDEAPPLEEAPASASTEATDPASASELAPTEGSELAPTELAPTEGSELAPTEGAEGTEVAEGLVGSRLESIIESLLFASDKPLGLADLKRLLGDRDGKKITAAVEALIDSRKGMGVEIAALSSGWHLRTNPENADWVSKLLVGRPVRLSRAMLETLAIVAYRQPVTRPEIDDIRGVDCGPVLKTLLDRSLVRIIGKKEEVGRPMLYGTSPEFLRVFNLRDLSELPTLREFYDLSAEDQSRVESEHGAETEPKASATTPKPDVALNSVSRGALTPEPEDTDPLLDELDEASNIAKKALGDLEPEAAEEAGPAEAEAEAKPQADEEPPSSAPPTTE